MSWGFVQGNGNFNGVTTATTVAVTFPGACTLGNKIIVAVAAGGGTVTNVKDNLSNTYTQLVGPVTATNAATLDLYLYALDVPSATALTLTATSPSAGQSATIVIMEVSGLLAGNTSAMLDGTAGTNTTVTNTIVSPTYSSTALNEFLVVVGGDDFDGIGIGTPSGYTLSAGSETAGNTGNYGVCAMSYKNSTNGAESGAYTLTAGTVDVFGQILVAFKLAAPPAQVVPPQVLPADIFLKQYRLDAYLQVPAPSIALVPVALSGTCAGLSTANASTLLPLTGESDSVSTANGTLGAAPNVLGSLGPVIPAELILAQYGLLFPTPLTQTGSVPVALVAESDGTSTANASLTESLTATAAGISASFATLTDNLTGTSAGSSTEYASITENLSGTAAGTSTEYATLANPLLSGTAAGTSTEYASITDSLTGTANGVSTEYATTQDLLSGTSAGTSTEYATLTENLSGESDGTSTANGTMGLVAPPTPSTQTQVEVAEIILGQYGFASAFQPPPPDTVTLQITALAGTCSASSTANASATSNLTGESDGKSTSNATATSQMTAECDSVSTASGTATLVQGGTCAALSTATASVVQLFAGTSAGTSSANTQAVLAFAATASGLSGGSSVPVIALSAKAAGLSTVYGSFPVAVPLHGTSAAVSSANANIRGTTAETVNWTAGAPRSQWTVGAPRGQWAAGAPEGEWKAGAPR